MAFPDPGNMLINKGFLRYRPPIRHVKTGIYHIYNAEKHF